MATCRRVLIKDINKELLVELIKKSYPIDRIITLDDEYRELFLDKMNYAFIVFDASLEGWTELDLDFNYSVKEHDNFLMNISKNYNTTILFGYAQTTSGDQRFLVFKNGEMIRHIYQKAYYYPNRIIMESNFGNKSSYEKNFQYPELGQNIRGFKFLDFYDDMQKMFRDYGYDGAKVKEFDEKYLHIEYLSGRNWD
ncbi:hypothetical protein VB264_21350 [Arcicella aquatica]|uniref:Uncharacterized protein n=1 Tax=Arcicella aquatica TaxID=217141 RepID=A0ABU5QU25_9BACT|nr:hypothetical protein [Arcicella aquatica]MEA5260360.1 hypothetical protein [Arcicella aquatica]